jgi:hypothetical protein
MKAQYFGDVSDYRKYALLRVLARSGKFKVGVCWMLTSDDLRADGNKRSFAAQPADWRVFDAALFDLLASVGPKPELADLLRVEREGLIPGAVFFNDMVPDSLHERLAFHRACHLAFNGCDLVFLDPDNGLEVRSRPKGRKQSGKFVFKDEISVHYAAGRSVLLYQHFPREYRPTFQNKIASDLSEALPRSRIWFFATAHVTFVLAARPEHWHRVTAVVDEIAKEWPAYFINPQTHPPAEPAAIGETNNKRSRS